MSFGDLTTVAGLEKLNTFLGEKSFIEGTELSDADVKVAKEVGPKINHTTYPNIARWYKTVSANKDLRLPLLLRRTTRMSTFSALMTRSTRRLSVSRPSVSSSTLRRRLLRAPSPRQVHGHH